MLLPTKSNLMKKSLTNNKKWKIPYKIMKQLSKSLNNNDNWIYNWIVQDKSLEEIALEYIKKNEDKSELSLLMFNAYLTYKNKKKICIDDAYLLSVHQGQINYYFDIKKNNYVIASVKKIIRIYDRNNQFQKWLELV